MHEAQAPDEGANIQNLNSVDLPQSSAEVATNPFYSILAGENKAKELLLLAPASPESQPNQAVNSSEGKEITEHIDTEVEIIIDSQLNHSPSLDEEIDQETNLENSPEDEWIAEPNAKQQAIVNSEFEKLLGLNEELRSANNRLYEQTEELTTALSESEAALQRQKKRSNFAESMLKQQTQELNAAQAQIQSLFEQLENAVQNVQRQESLADSHKRQLELSQQRLAQLERECALIQNKYSEQSQLLSQSENTCRELRARLKRQQRQTLQFKAALEKSLETSIPGYDTLDDSDSSFLNITTDSQLNKSTKTQAINSTQSIQPWSAPAESYKTQNDLWEEILTTSAANENENPIQEESSTWEFTANPNIETINQNPIQEESSTWEFTANPDIETIEDATNTQTEYSVNDDLVNRDLPNHDSADDEATVNQVVSPPDSSELEEKLDSVIQTFFASQTESVSQQSPQEQNTETDEAIITTWKTIIEPSGNNNHNSISVDHQNRSTENEQPVSFISSINENNSNETGDYWEEVSHFPAFDLSENTASFEILSDTDRRTNSPSPLIYPKRPPKGRKSFASVELPKFPQKNDNQ